MKTLKHTKFVVIIMAVLFMSLSVVSCSTHVQSGGPKKVPPGQAKKMSGSKSAKAYAPGQQKKN